MLLADPSAPRTGAASSVNSWRGAHHECGDGEICLGDTNGDCVVNQVDLDAVRFHWGPCLSGAAAPAGIQASADLFLANPTPEMAAFVFQLVEQLGDPE
jgi:hypothetical protein